MSEIRTVRNENAPLPYLVVIQQAPHRRWEKLAAFRTETRAMAYASRIEQLKKSRMEAGQSPTDTTPAQ